MKIFVVKHQNKCLCKICGKTVNKNSGLQCQGECKQWAHYLCLNYDPQKIRNIKAGVVRVACPCPICKEKDIQTDPNEAINMMPMNVNKPQNIAAISKTNNDLETKLKNPKIKHEYIIAKGDPVLMCTIENENLNNNTKCDFRLEKHVQKIRFKEPISNNEYVRQKYPHNVRIPEESPEHEIVPKIDHNSQCTETRQKPYIYAKKRILEACHTPERIPAASNIVNKSDTDNIAEVNVAPVRKKQFNNPLPHIHEKIKPPCSCLAEGIWQKNPQCVATLSSSDSSFYQPSPTKRPNQSIINTLENVCRTVGLLSIQIRELMGKIVSIKQQRTQGN